MSLKVWLPLTGTLDNKGCSGDIVTNNGTSVDNSGKLGKCYSFNGNSNYMTIPYNITTNISFCAWVYFITVKAAHVIDARISDTGYQPMYIDTSRIQYGGSGSAYVDASYSFTTGRWYHIAVTHDASIGKVYVDGVLIGSSTSAKGFTGGTSKITIGSRHNQSNFSNVKINDVRVYDHCLSEAEVREIAQALTCHYKFDISNQNLTPSAGTYTKTSPLTTSSTAKDGWMFISGSAFEGVPSTTYTISVECDGNIISSHNTGGINPSERACTFWAYICNTDTTKSWSSGGYDSPICLTNSNANYRKIGNTHVWTLTLSSAQKYISLRTNTYSDGANVLTVNWWNIKVEKGSEFTGWTPSASSTSYNALDFNTLIEPDASGLSHNGVYASSITGRIDVNSPRYNTAYSFAGATGYRVYNNTTDFNYTDNFSWSIWVKPNYTGTTAQYIFTVGRADAGGYGYGLQNSGDTSLNVRYGSSVWGVSITKNTWTHIAFTKSGTAIKIYKNGVLYTNTTFSGTAPTYSDGNGLGIGCFHYTGDIYPAYGSVSDFRIYATVLSAEDIYKLYIVEAKVDKSRNIHSCKFAEGKNAGIKNTGLIENNMVFEQTALFNNISSISYKPANNTSNSCSGNATIDLSIFKNSTIPITFNMECDVSWSNFAFVTPPSGGTKRCYLQGANRKIETGSYAWEGSNYFAGTSFVSNIESSSTGSTHVSKTFTIPVSWFATYDASLLQFRTDYSDGNGTVTYSNLKITLANSCAKLNNVFVLANNLIEM